MIEEAVSARLRSATAAPLAGVPVFYVERQEGTPLPALVIEARTESSEDATGEPSGTVSGSVRVVAMDRDPLGARALARAVRLRLNTYVGTVEIEAGTVNLSLFNANTSPVPSQHRDGQGQTLTHAFAVDLDHVLQEPPATPAP